MDAIEVQMRKAEIDSVRKVELNRCRRRRNRLLIGENAEIGMEMRFAEECELEQLRNNQSFNLHKSQ